MAIATEVNFQLEADNFIKYVNSIINPQDDGPLVFWIDLFCGAGGTSTGIHHAKSGRVFVAACVNHDMNAIFSHKENHPEAVHFIEDIRDFLVVQKLQRLVAMLRKEFPGCKINVWASLECTNFSKAKGGLARDADSRSLAEHMYMYLELLKPDYFWVENVREFMSWGPMYVPVVKVKPVNTSIGGEACNVVFKKNNKTKQWETVVPWKPISKDQGRDYVAWVEKIKSFGYRFDKKILNAADFGAYQSRERFFAQFAGGDLPICWPEQTHTKDKIESGLFPMERWKPVKDVLDLDDEGISIFNRKKPLSENTEKRILAGLEKFVAKGEHIFTKRYNGGKVNPEGKVNSIDRPMGTILSNCTHALVNSVFIKKYYSGRPEGKVIGVDGPAGTVKCIDGQAVVTASHFISQSYGGNPDVKVYGVDRPARTICAADNNSKVTVSCLNTYYGNGGVHDIEEPSPTITTKDRVAKVAASFLDQCNRNANPISLSSPCNTLTSKDKFSLVHVQLEEITDEHRQFILNQYSGGGQHTDIENPCGTVLSVVKQNLVTVKPWIIPTSFTNVGREVDEPAPTILASRKHHYLVNPQYNDKGRAIDDPCFTLIARMDKKPPYIVTTDTGECMVLVYDTDSPTMVKIKEFMCAYNIVDIKMRMLKIPELKQIQGFPKDYKLKGTQTEQKKYIGNAVEVTIAKALATANLEGIYKHYRKSA